MMLLKFLLFSSAILVQSAPQDPAVAAAAAAKGQVNGGGSNNFDCICRPIPGNTNNEFDCKCHDAAPRPAAAAGAPPPPPGGAQPNIGTAGGPPPLGPNGAGTPGPDIGTAGGPPPGPAQPPLGNAAPNGPGKGPPPPPDIPGAASTGTDVGAAGGPPPGSEPARGPGNNDADNKAALQFEFGDTYTYVLCIKKTNQGEKPAWDWLKLKDGTNVKIMGKWMTYTCTYGRTDPFLVMDVAYKAVLGMCKNRGYEIAQPANSFASNWYPFQVGTDLAEYYRRNSGLMSVSYDRMLKISQDKC